MGKHKGRKKNKILPKHRIQGVTNSSLEDKIKRSGIFQGDKVEFVHGMKEKMSEVLFDFAKPLLEGIEDDDYKAMEKAIGFAAVVWNLSLMPKTEQKEELNNILKIAAKDDPEMLNVAEGMARMLLDRKEKYFPNNRRIIINYEFGMRNGQPWLNVASTIE